MDRHDPPSPATRAAAPRRLPILMTAVLLMAAHLGAQEPLATTPPWNQIPQDARPSAAFAIAFGPWQAGYGQVDDASSEADRCKAVAAMPLAAVRIPIDLAIAKGALVSPGIIPASTTDADLRAYVAAAATGTCPPVGKRRPVPVPQPVATSPAPAAQVQVEAAKPVSAEVATALGRWEVRADGVDAGADAATKADLLTRLAKLDDLVAASGDIPAILAAARSHGLVPATASYAAMLAQAKAGVGAAQAPTPVTAATGAVTAAPAPAPTAPEAPKFVVGVKAGLYVLGDGAKWPPTDLPAAPTATIRLPAIPDVAPTWVSRAGADVSNHLIEHAQLDNQRFTAVAFSGHMYVSTDGTYVFALTSKDPAWIEVDGRQVVRTDWSLPISEWAIFRSDSGNWGNHVVERDKRVNTVSGTISLSGGKFHAIRVVACQQWRRDARANDLEPWKTPAADVRRLSPVVTGASFLARVTAPDGEPVPIKLYTQEDPAGKKKPKRDE